MLANMDTTNLNVTSSVIIAPTLIATSLVTVLMDVNLATMDPPNVIRLVLIDVEITHASRTQVTVLNVM